MKPSVKFLYAGGAVRRFHVVPTIKEDSVAQHSFGVAWMCYLLWHEDTEGQIPAELLLAALSHDLAEQYTGDVPAPAKRTLGLRSQFRQYEAEIENNNGVEFFSRLGSEERRVLKIADCMDGAARCAIEVAMGNSWARVPYNRFVAYLEELAMTPRDRRVLEEVTQLLKGEQDG